MRAQRQRRRPALELHRDAGQPTADAPTERLVVIQNAGLSNTVRLVVLGGDPAAPQRERPGIAVIELHPSSWTPEETLEVIHFFRERAEAKWAAEVEREARISRFMLELVP